MEAKQTIRVDLSSSDMKLCKDEKKNYEIILDHLMAIQKLSDCIIQVFRKEILEYEFSIHDLDSKHKINFYLTYV